MRGAPGDDADAPDEDPAVRDGDRPDGADGHDAEPDGEPAARTDAADQSSRDAAGGESSREEDGRESSREEDGRESPREEAADGDDAAAGPGEREAAGSVTESDPTLTDPAAIDPGELTVAERSLHPRIRILWIVRATIWALVLGAIATALTWAYLDVTLLAPVALAAVLLVLFVTHAVLRYRVWRYEFREDAIYLERGVLRRVRTVVPFVRIQHIDTARGPIERVAGLSTLVVYTAGSRGADVTIPGIEADRASDHQRRLKQLAIAAEDDTAV
jgi:membrane protein YdbS with pleckstrin-like domain